MNRIRYHNLSSPDRRNSCDGFHHIHKFLTDNLSSLVVPLEHNIANLKEVQFRMMNHIHSMGPYLESNSFTCGLMLKAIAIDLHSSSRSTSLSSRYCAPILVAGFNDDCKPSASQRISISGSPSIDRWRRSRWHAVR